MSSIKVVDINNEEAKQEEAVEQPIEEAKEEEVINELVEEPPQETKEVIEEVKEETKPVRAQDKMVRCPKCNKEMKYKNLDTVINKDVKVVLKTNQSNPIQVEVNEQPQEVQQQEPKPVIKQQIPQQPTNPLIDITNHYQLLQNQYIQQKKEKYNNLCQNMFAPKSKKR